MKKLLLLFSTSILFSSTNAQCPTNMYAVDITYVSFVFGPPPSEDTSCNIIVSYFPPNSIAYIYNSSSVLVDSMQTDTSGFGHISLTSSDCLAWDPGNPIVGTAVTGSCSVPISVGFLLPIKLINFTATLSSDNKVTLSWKIENEVLGTSFDIQESSDGINYTAIHSIRSNTINTDSQQYQYILPEIITGKKFYRLKITEPGASIKYSDIKTVSSSNYSGLLVYPTITSKDFSANLSSDYINGELKVYNNNGILVYSTKIKNSDFKVTTNWNKGVYYVRAISADGSRNSLKTVIIQ